MSGVLQQAIDNLLVGCAKAAAGERLLIVYEDPSLGWYDADLPAAIADYARQLQLEVRQIQVGPPEADPTAALAGLPTDQEITLFLARIGDQDRFNPARKEFRQVMCYARTLETLGSDYGMLPYAASVAMKSAVNRVQETASDIEISCPAGTRLRGQGALVPGGDDSDVSVSRFPLGVPQPVSANSFSGEVVLRRWLTSTGSRPYAPAMIPVELPVRAKMANGRILRFEGDDSARTQVEAHYQRVASLFGIDQSVVHSWHGGIHPGCCYGRAADQDPDQWSNNVFNHPRFLHFHTCGDYAPGEICWMVEQPTVSFDGVNLWEDGHFYPQRFDATAAVLATWPIYEEMLGREATQLGI